MVSLKCKLATMQLIGRFDIAKLNEFQSTFHSNGEFDYVDRYSYNLLIVTEIRM